MAIEVPKFLQPPTDESLLPELDGDTLEQLGQVGMLELVTVTTFWQDEGQRRLEDAAQAAIKGLSFDEVLTIIDEVDTLIQDMEDARGWPLGIWPEVADLSIDEDGNVFARIGHVHNVANIFVIDQVADALRESILYNDFGLSLATEDADDAIYEQVLNEEERRQHQIGA